MTHKKTHLSIKQQESPRARVLRHRVAVRIINVITALSIAVLLCIAMLPQPKAAAVAAYPACANTYFDDYDWEALMKAPSSPTNGGNYPSFSRTNDSYFIYKTKANVDAKRNIFGIAHGQAANKLTLDEYVDPLGVKEKRLYYTGIAQTNGYFINEPTSVKASTQNWAGTPGGSWPSGNTGYYANPGSANSFGYVNLTGVDINCIVVAHNVKISPGWTYDVPPTNLAIGVGAGKTCKATDLGCWIAKAFQGVQDTLSSVALAIAGFIAQIWLPDGDQITTDFNEFQSFLVNKLGFLTYPFTFIVDMFTAFGNTTNSWCNTNSCSKNFGNFFGKSFTLDLNAPATVYPTLWAYFLNLIRGITVLGLILAVRQKYMRITNK
jgi:hypothetical protein